jgi:hypothetical protein
MSDVDQAKAPFCFPGDPSGTQDAFVEAYGLLYVHYVQWEKDPGISGHHLHLHMIPFTSSCV